MTIYNRQPSPTQSQSATINMTEDTPLVTDGNRHHNLLPALPCRARAATTSTYNYIYFPNKGNCLQSAHTALPVTVSFRAVNEGLK
jgi:hypothetical protein